MAGFQVANFDFGRNIVDANLRRQQLAAQERASARSAALQARGQDMAAAQNEAARVEQARQFDARMADSQAAREESARQFDNRLANASMAREESARQFDAGQSLREREFAAKRSDAERTQSWDDALKTQQMEAAELEFAKRNEELNRIMAIRQKEDEERAHQQELIDSAYGNAVITTELGGGYLSLGQVNDFNKRNGTNYNYIGKINPLTGKEFNDGKIHFLTYAMDKSSGRVLLDPQSNQPLLEYDLPIGQEFYRRVMEGYFGKYNGLISGKTTDGTISSKGMFDMRTSQINSLMAQRKALMEEGNPNNQKTIAAIDQQIGLLNQMNGAATGVSEFARALGVTGLGGNGGNNPIGYETVSSIEKDSGRVFNPEDTVESNGRTVKRVQHNPKSGEYIVNTKHEQSDGSYSFKVSKDKAHLGEKWVTFVDTDGNVKQRLREENDGFTEQHENGLYMKVKNQKGKTIDLFVPAGKVVKTAFGNKVVSGEKGNYTLVDTDEKPNWTAREGIIANWSNRDTEKRRKSVDKPKNDKVYMELGEKIWYEQNPSTGSMGITILPRKEELIKLGKEYYQREHAQPKNWGARRSGGTEFAQKANQILDELVAEKLGIFVDEAKKTREKAEAKKKAETKK